MSIRIVMISQPVKGLGKLTGNSKYIDRHGERLRLVSR